MSDLPQTPRIASDYTTRAGYMADYRKRNREAINARKRRWRADRKQDLPAVSVLAEPMADKSARAVGETGEARESTRTRLDTEHSRGGRQLSIDLQLAGRLQEQINKTQEKIAYGNISRKNK